MSDAVAWFALGAAFGMLLLTGMAYLFPPR